MDIETLRDDDDEDAEGWDELLDAIEQHQVVPVVGQEMLAAEFEGRSTSLMKVIAERVASAKGLPPPQRSQFELDEVVDALLARRAAPDEPHSAAWKQWKDLKEIFPLPPALRQLAAVRGFDLFITTTPDDMLARSIDAVRFRGNARTRRLAFSVKQATAAQAEALNPPDPGVPTVYSLFGQFSNRAEYVLHDEDALEFIHALVSRDVPPPEWLTSMLRGSDLLFIGTHLPDWLERFVLRSANRERLRKADRKYYIARERLPSASPLADFLGRFGGSSPLRVYEGNGLGFAAELNRRWLARHPEITEGSPPPLLPPAARGRVFISYSWRNAEAVQRLYEELLALGADVWYDRRELTPGSQWHPDIVEQIRDRVQLFIAVLSREIEDKASDSGVVFEEWREAVERNRKFTAARTFFLPVIIDAEWPDDYPACYPILRRTYPLLADVQPGFAPNGVPDSELRGRIGAELEKIDGARS